MHLHEYHGLVFNMPAERIPVLLAERIAKRGEVKLWQFQAFENHAHLSTDRDPIVMEPRLVALEASELAEAFPDYKFIVELDPCALITWYQASPGAPTEDDADFADFSVAPSFRLTKTDSGYVVSPEKKQASRAEGRVNPDDVSVPVVVKRIDGGKEIQDLAAGYQEYFRALATRTGSSGACEHCQATDFTEPEIPPEHRGIRTIICKSCGARLVHSTRTIRFKVNF